MKKVLTATSILASSLINAPAVFAQPNNVNVDFNKINFGINPAVGIGNLVGNGLRIAMIIAALLVLVYLVIGAFQWITSGGDKEKVGKARGTIMHALIGLAILALAGVIVVVVGMILNINILNLGALPNLGSP